jgi:hypothetical protein
VQSYSRVRGLPISLSELARDLDAEIDALPGGHPELDPSPNPADELETPTLSTEGALA